MQAVVGEPAEWSVNDYLTAHVVDGINQLIYVYVSAHSKNRSAAPKPIPRPEDRQRRERVAMSSANEVAAFMASINNGR